MWKHIESVFLLLPNANDGLWTREMCKQPHLCKHFALKCANINFVQTRRPQNVQICKRKIYQPQMCKHHAVKCAKFQFRCEFANTPQLQIIVFFLIKNQFTSTKLTKWINSVWNRGVAWASIRTRPWGGGGGDTPTIFVSSVHRQPRKSRKLMSRGGGGRVFHFIPHETKS